MVTAPRAVRARDANARAEAAGLDRNSGNLVLKKSCSAAWAARAVLMSVLEQEPPVFIAAQYEYPTPAGDSSTTKFATVVQAYGLSMSRPSRSMISGPCSCSIPRMEEEPGPPLSHSTTGASWASGSDEAANQ
eukprot:scaffold10240_cov107-Isochrysis_galbana.AAC.4